MSPEEACERLGVDVPDGPLGALDLTVMDLRAYAEAKAIWDRPRSGNEKPPQGPLFDRVKRTDFEIAREDRDRHLAAMAEEANEVTT